MSGTAVAQSSRIVAKTFDAAPGLGQTQFRRPSISSISPDGSVCLRSDTYVSSIDDGYWHEVNGELQLLAVDGATAPGGGVFDIDGLEASYLPQGMGGYKSMWARSGTTTGIWVSDGGTLSRVASEGDTVLNGNPVGVIANDERVNVHKEVAFRDPQGILFKGNGGAIVRVFSVGDSLGGGFTVSGFDADYYLDDMGQVTFIAVITDGSETREVVMRGEVGSVLKIAETRTVGDGTEGQEFRAFELLGVSPDGIVLFDAAIADDDTNTESFTGIWRAMPGGTASRLVRGPIMLEGMAIQPTEASVAAGGAYAFAIPFVGIMSSDSAGQPTALVTTSSTLGTATYSDFANVVLNDAGHIAFDAFLTGPDVTTANDKATILVGVNGLEVIARKGDALTLDDGRTVTITATGSAGDLGRGGARSLDDVGHLVYSVGYSDGMGPQQAVLVTTAAAGVFDAAVAIMVGDYATNGETFELPVVVTVTNTSATGPATVTITPEPYVFPDANCDRVPSGCAITLEAGATITLPFVYYYDRNRVGAPLTLEARLDYVDSDPTNNVSVVELTYPGQTTSEDCSCTTSAPSTPTALLLVSALAWPLRRRRRRG